MKNRTLQFERQSVRSDPNLPETLNERSQRSHILTKLSNRCSSKIGVMTCKSAENKLFFNYTKIEKQKWNLYEHLKKAEEIRE